MRRAAALLAILVLPASAQDAPPPGRVEARACAVCHGPLGISTAPDAPNLAGQPREYLAAQLRAYRSGRRPHEVMNVVARPLTDAQIAALAEWFSSLEVVAREKGR